MTRSDLQGLIDNIADGVPNTASKVRTILNALADGTDQEGDIKEIDVSNAYLLANFDATGLGINERLGWAICNGNNGTRDRRGRIPMQYSATYPTLGATGGEYQHTLTSNEMPIHSHLNGISDDITGLFVYGATTSGMPGSATTDVDSGGSSRTYQGNTSSSGGGLAHNNMQPYIVTLFIQKL